MSNCSTLSFSIKVVKEVKLTQKCQRNYPKHKCLGAESLTWLIFSFGLDETHRKEFSEKKKKCRWKDKTAVFTHFSIIYLISVEIFFEPQNGYSLQIVKQSELSQCLDVPWSVMGGEKAAISN